MGGTLQGWGRLWQIVLVPGLRISSTDFDTFKTEEERQMELEHVRQGKEEILEEAAGILKDILQELDTRRDERADLDEDEARVIGLTLFKLSDYILPMKCVLKSIPFA
jgi:hypothetical protein